MVKGLILAACLALAACQASRGTFCAVAKPVRPTAQTIAAMTDTEIRDVLAHNTKGQKLCGWKP